MEVEELMKAMQNREIYLADRKKANEAYARIFRRWKTIR